MKRANNNNNDEIISHGSFIIDHGRIIKMKSYHSLAFDYIHKYALKKVTDFILMICPA